MNAKNKPPSQAIFNMNNGDMAVAKGSGYGKVEVDKSKTVEPISFMIMSQKLN
jgi:hypothetical protein